MGETDGQANSDTLIYAIMEGGHADFSDEVLFALSLEG